MSFEIIHLSDLHFGNPDSHLRRTDINTALDSLLSQATHPNRMLVISGDITFRGQKIGYTDATEIIGKAVRHNGINLQNVLVCPGNHDVVKEDDGHPYFESFDIWSSGLRGDKQCTFANNPVRLITNDIGDFLLLNTAYSAEHDKGTVNINDAKKLLKQLSSLASAPPKLRIAIAHHHMIPVQEDDLSTTRNAYMLIKLLDEYGFTALLHGHQHAMLKLGAGESNLLLSGIGSFNFFTPGYINSAAIYRGEKDKINEIDYFGITLDTPEKIVKIKSVKNQER